MDAANVMYCFQIFMHIGDNDKAPLHWSISMKNEKRQNKKWTKFNIYSFWLCNTQPITLLDNIFCLSHSLDVRRLTPILLGHTKSNFINKLDIFFFINWEFETKIKKKRSQLHFRYFGPLGAVFHKLYELHFVHNIWILSMTAAHDSFGEVMDTEEYIFNVANHNYVYERHELIRSAHSTIPL